MPITDWPAESRPRERLLSQGAQALSDAELLAVFLRTGVRGRSAVDLGRDLIARFGSLPGLLAADPAGMRLPGLGSAKAAQLKAVLELARRSVQHDMQRSSALSSPQAVRDYLRLLLGDRPHEVFAVVYLDAQHRVIKTLELFRGTLTQTSVYPREVVIEALALGAAAVIFTHNHPSGCCEPSRADEHLTQTLKTALSVVEIRVLDHFIVTRDTVLSFAERGLL